MLADSARTVAEYLFPEGELQSNSSLLAVGDLSGAKGQSLKVTLVGEKKGMWRDYATGEGGDLVELWALVRCAGNKGDALREIRDYLGLGSPTVFPLPVAKPAPVTAKPATVTPIRTDANAAKPISREYHQQMKSRLLKSQEALAYLVGPKRGLTRDTITRFGLGLSGEHEGKDGRVTVGALVAPMMASDTGAFLNRSAYINVPEVTQNPLASNGWMKGEPRTYYADVSARQRILFICEGLKDVWRHWQALSESSLRDDILIISSTHGSAIPKEWRQPEFWERWGAVYLGQDNDEAGAAIAERVLEVMGREARRIQVPDGLGKDWTDFWQNGGSIALFRELLDTAPVASIKLDGDLPPVAADPLHNIPRIGRFSHKPVDINCGFANGFMYYPTETHVVKRDETTGQLVERIDTLVIRSDRTTHHSMYAPAPEGTPLFRRVLKLTDGTVIDREPRVSVHRTWDFESIRCYLEKRDKTRPLAAIVADVVEFLRQAIWLPNDEDYVVLALTVPVTYVQTLFEAVPLLLLNGPAGSGKSQTGNTMARLCANGVVIGQVSAAAAARLIDETRGFVALDDVEHIAAKSSGKDAQVNELVQALKVSYSKQTGVKYWHDMKTGRNEPLNFYGVKLLGNTLGADSILETRMIRIQTRTMPEGMLSSVREFDADDLMRLRELRNELHTWAFKSIAQVLAAYRDIYQRKTDRRDEIAAPLRTMARLVGSASMAEQLETALKRRAPTATIIDDPVETLKEAVQNLIKQGFDTVTVTHLRLEMRSLLDANYGMSSTTEIPEWDRSEWIGRQLRSNDMVADVDLGRKRVYGKNLRLVRFSDWMVSSVIDKCDDAGNTLYKVPNRKAEDFCQGCSGCPYRTAGCELQATRLKDKQHSAAKSS